MRKALKSYIEAQGYDNVFIDFIPDVTKKKEAIALFCYSDIPEGDGSYWQRYQIQVRRADYSDALDTARELYELLDSGADETPVQLTAEKFCFARQLKGPRLLDRGAEYNTFYFEVAIFGDNGKD